MERNYGETFNLLAHRFGPPEQQQKRTWHQLLLISHFERSTQQEQKSEQRKDIVNIVESSRDSTVDVVVLLFRYARQRQCSRL